MAHHQVPRAATTAMDAGELYQWVRSKTTFPKTTDSNQMLLKTNRKRRDSPI
jgi:hypothetical protein